MRPWRETGEVEIELGPAEYLREGAERALLAPDLRINYGFIPGWKGALEGRLAPSNATRCPCPIPDAITMPQLPQR